MTTPRTNNGRFAPRTAETITTGDIGTTAPAPDELAGAALLGEPKPESKATALSVWTGNVMYVQREVKNQPDKMLVQTMVRFKNDDEIADQVVNTFVQQDDEVQVGALICFHARGLSRALDKNDEPMSLNDGTPIFRPSGYPRNFALAVVRKAGKREEAEVIGAVQSVGFLERIAKASPLMASWLGLDKKSET